MSAQLDELQLQVERLDYDNKESIITIRAKNQDAKSKIAQWESENASRLARARRTLNEIAAISGGDLAALSVAAREIRSMIR